MKSTTNPTPPKSAESKEGLPTEMQKKEGYKMTKLGWIPEEWEVSTYGKCVDIKVGRDIKENHYKPIRNNEFSIPVYSNTVHDFGLYGYYDFEEFGGESLTIVGRGAGLGTPFYRSESYGAIGRLLVLIPNQNVDAKFLSEYTKGQVNFHFESSGIPQLTGVQLAKYKVALPPLPEQKKIAAILSTWDAAIDTTQALIKTLQLRKKGLMQQLLTGKKRLPGYEGEWEENKLSDIANRLTKKNEELNDNVVTISAQRGFILQEDYFNKRVASKTLSGYYLIDRGQFAYNKSYSKGYPMGAFKRLDDFDKAVVTTLYICFEITDKADSGFMLYYFEGGMLIRNLMKIAQEGGRAHGLLNIGLADFFGLKLTLPTIQEQTAIAQVLTKSDEEIEQTQKYLEQLQAQKKGLMQQLLTGQKRVSV